MKAEVQREIESKFDVAPDFTMPALEHLAGPDGRVETDTVALSSTYHDTAATNLLRFHLTLRRREGDTDTGWQLKVPAEGARTELRWPLGEQSLPEDMAALLAPFVGAAPIVPALRLDVVRARYRLRDAAGTLLAEIAHDDVRAVPLGAEVRARRWHEVEVELAQAPREMLAAAGAELIAAGAFSSTSRSKLARALLGIGNEGVGTPRTSAGAVLVDYLDQQADALVAGHFALHRDDPESIHRTRVACRRMRSTLRTFEQCFDADQAHQLEGELRWYAGVLGEVRDLEVLRIRIAAAIADLPEELIVGPVAEHVDKQLSAELATRRAQVLEVMAGERYAAVLAEAIRWREDPPFTAAAGRPASTLQDAVDRMEKRLARRLEQATAPGGLDTDLHRARKAGKQVRYAAEAATGNPKVDQAREAAVLQELLGEFQDSIVAEELLRRLAADASDRGEDAFTYGVLVAEQRRIADRVRKRARKI